MANSLESQAEEDEEKKWNIPLHPQQITARKQCKQKSQYAVKFGPCTLTNKGAEGWKAIKFLMLGFYTQRGKKVFTFSTIKAKQALSLICLNLHFELA